MTDNARANARNRGKVWEREVAKDLGTKRTGPTGMDDADIIHYTLAVECKAYGRIAFRAADWQQAKDNAKGKVPILAIKPKGAKRDAIVIMSYDYFVALHTDREEQNGS